MIKYLGKNTRWCNNNINKIYTWYNLNLCVILIHKHAILIYMLLVNICIICFYSSSWKVRIIGRIILLYFNYVIQTSVSCNCKLEISLSIYLLKFKKNYTYFSSLLPFSFFLILLLEIATSIVLELIKMVYFIFFPLPYMKTKFSSCSTEFLVNSK